MKSCIKVLGIGWLIILTMFTNARADLLPVELPLALPQLPLQLFTPVEWDASPGANVTGYAVYYTVAGVTTRLDAGQALKATIPLLVGSRYSIFVVAYTSNGVESDPSNIVNYTPGAMTRLKLTRQSGNTLRIQFRTSPLATCRIECTSSLNPPKWQTLGTVVADLNGDVSVDDPPGGRPQARFYRAVRL